MSAWGRWPSRNDSVIATICAEGGSLATLRESSPTRVESDKPQTEEILKALFPGDPFLCCAWSRHRFDTRPLSNWYQLDKLQFLVPNPMKDRCGRTKEGKISAHTLDNTGPRRFLVIEQDEGDLNRQAAILLHLAQIGPLVLVVHSGGKSLHGWFDCKNVTEEKLRPFMEYAVMLGTDPATWTRSQFVRMPDGLRENGTRQRVHYFNPKNFQ
jgi:hypothetical protein